MRQLALVLLIFSVLHSGVNGSFAQGALEEAEIVIRKDRKITLPPVTRNFEKIPQLPVRAVSSKQVYQFKSFDYNLSPMEPSFRTLNYQADRVQPDYAANYVKAGYGNFGTPYLEGYLGSKKSKDYLFNLYVKHLSSKTGPVLNENSGDGRTQVAIGGKLFNGINTLSGGLDYSGRKVHFFGYDPELDFTADAIKQRFTRFSINMGLENTKRSEILNYSFQTDWAFFKDRFNAKETKFHFDISTDYRASASLTLSLEVQAVLSKRWKKATQTNRNYLNMKPRVQYTGGRLAINAGVNFVGDNDCRCGMRLYPAAEASFAINREVKVYAGYEGTVLMNTLESSVDINPFLKPDIELMNTKKQRDFYGKIVLRLAKNLRVNTGFSLASLQNLPLFTNAKSDSSRFEIHYYRCTANRMNIFSEANYELPKWIQSSLRIDFFNYSLNSTSPEFAQPWHLPRFKAAFNNTFFPVKGMAVTTDLYYLGGLNAWNGESARAFELKDIIDLNLGGRYELSKQFGVFLQLNNLLGVEYQRYLNYPSRGIQFLGGVSVSF